MTTRILIHGSTEFVQELTTTVFNDLKVIAIIQKYDEPYYRLAVIETDIIDKKYNKKLVNIAIKKHRDDSGPEPINTYTYEISKDTTTNIDWLKEIFK